MYTYPLLTPLEQAGLPRLTAAPAALPSQFADSTHQVFLCDTVDGRMVLKVCDDAVVAKSDFWHGVNDLFGVNFPNSLARIQRTYDVLAEQGLYAVPAFVVSSRSEFQHQFVLTRFIEGSDIEAANSTKRVTDAMVVQLAKHIAQLHQYTKKNWGDLHAPTYAASEWSERLHATLLALAEQSAVIIPEPILQDVLTQAKTLQEAEFVPMMLDLRWDQFRWIENAQSPDALALIDLDAFVVAPRALDLVLLEYILTLQQFALFKATYTATDDWPDYSAQKSSYQLLLFLMQVLGETDLVQWMKRI